MYEMKDAKTGEIFAGKIVSKKSLTKPRSKQKVRMSSEMSHTETDVDCDRLETDPGNGMEVLLTSCSWCRRFGSTRHCTMTTL